MSAHAHVPRVFVDASLAVDTQVELGAANRHHLATVLRLSAGAPVTLFNGDGHEYAARVALANRKAMTLTVETRDTPVRESPLSITLVQAIARGERMDFALAKAVELGVTHIQPVFTARGKVRLERERLARKQNHWQRVAESAAEQSGRLIRPCVAPAKSLTDHLETETAALRLMLARDGGNGLGTLSRAPDIALLVGPESGLSETEIDAGTAAGWRAIVLGARVLRTETAGMASLAALQTLWGDLG